MWEQYKNQIIGAILVAVITAVGAVAGQAYLHVNDKTHIKDSNLQEISEKLVQIKSTVDKNEQSLRYMRFYYLNDRYSELDSHLQKECDDLRKFLYPFGGAPDPK